MAHELKFDHPHFPEGTIFAISGLPEVANGQSIGIDEDAERFFIGNTGLTVEDAFADDPTVTVTGSSELSADDTKQLIGDDRGTPEELGQAGGEVIEEVAITPPVPVVPTGPPKSQEGDSSEGGDVNA